LDRHLLIVANTFRIAGCVLGLPSLLVCLWLTAIWIQTTFLMPKISEAGTPDINIQRDGIVGLLVLGGTMVGKAFQFAASAFTWIAGVVDIAAFALALIGAALFFTGRGLVGHATWARILAGVAAFAIFAVSFLAFTSIRRGPNFIALVPLSAAVYALWVLIRRFGVI
jgi:hypothetical protein